jgi:hypothetical protein
MNTVRTQTPQAIKLETNKKNKRASIDINRRSFVLRKNVAFGDKKYVK